MENVKGKLILIGAGPGDPELISVKGMKAVKKADVILYDALVSLELCGLCKASMQARLYS